MPFLPCARSPPLSVGEISESLKPLPLDVEGGGVAQWKLEEIASKRDRALEVKDYRLASELDDLHTILTTVKPEERQPWSPPRCERPRSLRFLVVGHLSACITKH